jgi:hypothetical protein
VTHDPWSKHDSLACPACHVTGKVVQNDDYDAEPPFICCECGSSWIDTGSYADESLKECRVNLMRLVEGRPYEPPKPKEPGPDARKLDLTAFDGLLADAWREDIERRVAQPALTMGGIPVVVDENVRGDGVLLGEWGDDEDPTE